MSVIGALSRLLEVGGGAGVEGRLVMHQANLAFTLANDRKESLGQLDRMLLGPGLNDGKAADQLLGLSEWAIDHGELAVGDPNLGAFGAGLESIRSEQHPISGHLPDKPAHLLHMLLGGR